MHANIVSATQRVAPVISLTRAHEAAGFSRERGTALIFALVMLLLLTLLGITAVTTSSLQERMAGNMRDQYMAQQAGDSIVLDGQSWVLHQDTKPVYTPCPPASDATGYIWGSDCLPAAVAAFVGAAAGPNWWLTANDKWWLKYGLPSSISTNKMDNYVVQEPLYLIEKIQRTEIDDPELGKPKKYLYFFRTTGWSVGTSNYARGLFQDVFSKRSDMYPN